MVSVYQFLLIVFLLQVINTSSIEAGWFKKDNNAKKALTIQQKYDLIDKYLTKKIESILVEDNYNEAVNLLEISKTNPIATEAKGILFDKEFEEPLMKINSLLKFVVDGDSYCNEVTYDVLRDNESSLGKDIAKIDFRSKKLRRIDRVIKDVALDIASDCSYSYPSQLKKLVSANKKELDNIETILDSIISQTSSNDLDNINLKDPQLAQSVLYALKETKRSDPIVKNILTSLLNTEPLMRSQVDHVLDEYLYKKCDIISKTFSELVDQVLYFNRFNEFLTKEVSNDLNMLNTWIQYTAICNTISSKDTKSINDNFMHVGLFYG